MDEALKLNMHSNRTTAASIAIVSFVTYVALVSLQSILMPLAIAILLYFLIKPLERLIFQKVKKRSLSYGSVVLSAILTIYFISIFLYSNLSNFIDEIPEINVALEKKIERYSEKNLYGLEDVIFDSDFFSSIASPSNIETFVISILGSLGGFMTTMSTVLVFLLFIILEEETLASRFNAAFPNSYGKAKTIVSGAFESISAYVVSKVTCSAGQAAVMTLILSPWGFDIPGWFLFGVLCFLLDFIPIIGALFATIPPVIISFIVLEPSSAVIMLILLIANQQMFGTLIEPNLSGAKLGISPIILLLTVMLSAQVWGIAGAIIGAPMIIIVRLILEENERTEPLAKLLAISVEEE